MRNHTEANHNTCILSKKAGLKYRRILYYIGTQLFPIVELLFPEYTYISILPTQCLKQQVNS